MAQCILGGAYERGEFGLKKSPKRAAQLYELSAAQGHSPAQFNLGLCFMNGTGVNMDKKKALHYITLAAGQGLDLAQFALGYMYAQG